MTTTGRPSTEPAAGNGADTGFGRTPSRGARALAWWSTHCDPQRADPVTRAKLRRARSRLDALQVAAAADLARRLGAAPRERYAADWLVHGGLDLARVLAHVEVHDASRHPMEAAGWRRFPGTRRESDGGDDRPLLSEARFRRLLQTGDGEEKVSAFIRLVALLGGKVNVERLASDFLFWNHPDHGDRVRERWAFHYLAAGSAAPSIPSPDDEDPEA